MIEFRKDNSIDKQEIILTRLKEYNRCKCQWLRDNGFLNSDGSETKRSNFLVFDDDKLVGGVIGFVEYNWYILDLLYIDEVYRRRDIGTTLINWVKEFSKNHRLTGIKLETWDFQARGFYEKNGFTVFAELKNYPPGTTVFYLKYEL